MKKLLTVEEVAEKILNGEVLVLAADEGLLSRLPKGKWIGGTIPYFMGDDGGTFTKERIYVDTLPEFSRNVRINLFDEESLKQIAAYNFRNGYTMLIIPAFSPVHVSFAENSYQYENIFLSPLAGWVAGVDLDDLGKTSPKVFNGITGESSDAKAIAMHVELPPYKTAVPDIVNLFEQDNTDSITFDETGFEATECYINGQKRNLAEYLLERKVDTRLPLVASYCGAMINTSFNDVDREKRSVKFYAPVFKGVEYKIAHPVENYMSAFTATVSGLNGSAFFSCNCILNYLYSELEGKKTADFTGPVTFGEIAYQLLNQTMVYLNIEDSY